MKKLVLICHLGIFIMFFLASGLIADPFTTIRLTDDSFRATFPGFYRFADPDLNDNGDVVWRGYDGNDFEVFLYRNSTREVIRLSDNDFNEYRPHISNIGHVSWETTDHIFLYNGSTVSQINDDTLTRGVGWQEINDWGDVVWEAYYSGAGDIFLYENATGTASALTDGSIYVCCAQITDNYVVWEGLSPDDKVHLYNGLTTVSLGNDWNNQHPMVSASGYVVWEGYEGPGFDREIYIFNGYAEFNFTNNLTRDRNPQINNNNFMIWEGVDPIEGDPDLFGFNLDWAVGEVNLSDGWIGGISPQLNDLDHIASIGWDAIGSSIYLYDGYTEIQVSTIEPGISAVNPQINDKDFIVWQTVNSDYTHYDIYLARPADFTPEGPDITIQPEDTTTGEYPITITFEEVVNGGNTFVTSHSTDNEPPSGFKLGDPETFFEVTLEGVQYSGPIEVCIDYSNISFDDEEKLQLFHRGDGETGWQNKVTSYLDTTQNIICGNITSFSYLGIFEEAILEIEIDIMPGSVENNINLGSAGAIPVGVLSSSTFDATQINPDTISLNGASVKLVGKGSKYLSHEEDINEDGLVDLVVQVLTDEFSLEEGQTQAVLEGAIFDGTTITGNDQVTIVP
jgi:hypothetical protein